jgi:hypothetical protein
VADTKLVKCPKAPMPCESKYQDDKYGKGVRVANRIAKPSAHGNAEWRCTVCGGDVH